MKRNKLYGRVINRVAYNLNYEDDVTLMDYMIDVLKFYNIDYVIDKCIYNDNWVDIRVNCDDDMMKFLSDLELNYEFN